MARARYDSSFYRGDDAREPSEETLRCAELERTNQKLRDDMRRIEQALRIAGRCLLPYVNGR